MVTITPYDEDGNAIEELYQWDRGITVVLTHELITDAMEVHFANGTSGTAYVVSGTYSDGSLTATIPAAVLEKPARIYGYVYTEDGNVGQTILVFVIGIIRRAKPSDYADVDSADYVSTTTILAEVEELLELAQAAADAAAVSEGNASDAATLAESWAVGGTGTRDGEDEDNAQYYAEVAAANAAENTGFYWDTDGYFYCSVDDDEE